MIVVVGAGIAGLAVAWELTKMNQDVTIVDESGIAKGASGAATAYLEPRTGDSFTRKIEWESIKKWPEWAKEIQKESGTEINLNQNGQIRVETKKNKKWIEEGLIERKGKKWGAKKLSEDEVREMEPQITKNNAGGVFVKNVMWADGKKICNAIANAITKNQNKILIGEKITSIVSERNKVEVVTQTGKKIAANKIIIASGIGTNNINGLNIPKCKAVRGVNVALSTDNINVPIKYHIRHKNGYVCPVDNNIIVGTTYEKGITNLNVKKEVTDKIINDATKIVPSLRLMSQKKIIVGVRAKMPSGQILIGKSNDNPNVFFSLGHAGSGFLRAPKIADIIAKQIISS